MRNLLIKLAALFGFLGGPMYLSDLLRDDVGQKVAFGICFAPLGLMAFATLTILDEDPTPLPRAIAILGGVGAVLVLAMNGYVAVELIRGAGHPNQGMITTGIVVGAWSVMLYARWMLRFLRSTPVSSLRN